ALDGELLDAAVGHCQVADFVVNLAGPGDLVVGKNGELLPRPGGPAVDDQVAIPRQPEQRVCFVGGEAGEIADVEGRESGEVLGWSTRGVARAVEEFGCAEFVGEKREVSSGVQARDSGIIAESGGRKPVVVIRSE